MGKLSNKIAIITGSSSGLGRAITLALAREGANIVCSDIREQPRSEGMDPGKTTVELVKELGAKVIFVKCDTTNAKEVEQLVQSAVKEFGRLDIMVNNAGISAEANDTKPVWEFPEEYFDRDIAVNTKGVFLGCKYASLQMKDQQPHANGDRGWIINLASIFGLVGTQKIVGYVSSKHGVMGITRVAAVDCAPHRIHVNSICPGYIHTSMTEQVLSQGSEVRAPVAEKHPFKGLGNPEDIARAAVFLASEDAGWVTGVGLPVDGGYTAI